MPFKNFFAAGLRRYFWPAASVLLLTASFQTGFSGFSAWLALVPLLISIKEDDFRQAAAKGFATGFFHSVTLF